MTFIVNAWTNINKLDRNEPGAAEVTARLWAERSSSFHCFQLFLEENVTKKPQDSFPTVSTKIPPRTIPAAPAGRELRSCVKCKNRSMRCPRTRTPSSWRDTNNLSDGPTSLRRFIISWKSLAGFECDCSTASEKSCKRGSGRLEKSPARVKKQLQERLTAD